MNSNSNNIYVSIIVPVYNRPVEVGELLKSLSEQSCGGFEVIIVEDGSVQTCDDVVEQYRNLLDIKYFNKENSGPGPSRNYGFERASGAYCIFLDSDCVLPTGYFEAVQLSLAQSYADCFGGPDRAHGSFSNLQKAINYSMTSFLTTGGIRGGAKKLDRFLPRSFNMGISASAFRKVSGFSPMRFGEDLDLSLRLIEAGYKTALYPGAYVFHKRRTDFRKFFRQVYNSGIARIVLNILHPGSLKLVHLLPSAFVVGMVLVLLASVMFPILLLIPLLYSLLLFVDSLFCGNSFTVALLSVPAAWIQLSGYGLGFLDSVWNCLVLKKKERTAFQNNFYK